MKKRWTPQPLKTTAGQEMRKMLCGKLNLTYQYFGHNKGKTTILFLYGFGGNIEYLREIGPYLSDNDKYSFLTVDYPGHGFGEENGPFVVSEFIDSLCILLDKLEEKKIILIGYSFGGAVAMQLHHRIKERIEKLVLLNCDLHFAYNLYKYWYYKAYQALLCLGVDIAIDKISVPLLTDKHMRPEIRKEVKSVLLFNSLSHVKDFYRQVIFSDYEYLLKEINCPTLVIGSKCDFLITMKRFKRLQSLISGSDLYIQEDIGHLCVVTNAKATSKVILKWLE
ncbi:MAG: alpha/beta hydrolase [Spirochaetales bacterium]|nr:alpha/beta hydrolase [Spirochaetales bacterium]